MLLIPCPYCGPRPELEFTYAGEAHLARPADPGALDDVDWAKHLYGRSNPRGEHAERWRHTHGCARFFNAVRDTVSDRFLASYKASEVRPGGPVPAETATADSLDAPSVQNSTERWGAA